ncbi:MAG: type IX secretion system membrane protein PorP/SprF [Bacteroidales bacterium]|nr:type IX secretion system membrane protein PorP/SprF [Bacteroidales bacterium]MBN2699615.1 type IX secretion system membrane protein PorP/SprF [Bacteroidales bacterium]
MRLLNRLTIMLVGMLACSVSVGQKIPSKPFSYPVYAPLVINPAIAGSKDFKNINLMLRVNGSPGAQMLTYNSRLPGKASGAAIIPGEIPFSNFGVGGYIVHDPMVSSRNLGMGLSGSYHIPLNRTNLSFLSIGLSARGTYNIDKEDGETPPEGFKPFTPNADFGLYYYGPTAFAGLSSTNLLGMINDSVTAYGDETYVPREYHFYGGYKFLLSRKQAIVLEPSILVSATDSTLSELYKDIIPYLKLYMGNFFVGTCFRDWDNLSLFMQYQFPRFFTGVFIEFPRTGFLTADNIIIEVSLGLNLGGDKNMFIKNRHW